jgi:hypothetical protein
MRVQPRVVFFARMLATERVIPAPRAAADHALAEVSLTLPDRARSRVRDDEMYATFQPRARLPVTPTVTWPLSLVVSPPKAWR